MPAERHSATLPRSPQPGRARRRSHRRGLLVIVATVAVVSAGAWFGSSQILDTLRPPQCTVTAGGMTETFDPEQTGNAALIAAVSMKRGLPPRAATIALTTAYQESKILNIRYGDRDSLGLFQQRPSQGWGTEQQILDPLHATNAFYDALVKLKGYESADITTIAQQVQRSAHPELYRDHEAQGRVLASSLTGHSPASLTCRLDDLADGPVATPERMRSDLATEMGVSRGSTTRATDGRGGVLTVTAPDQRVAWAVGHWAVARAAAYGATKVSVGDRAWNRSDGAGGWSQGTPSRTVRITLG